MALDWTTMVNHVVIAGRPADVEDAALGWQELIGNVRDVCTSLEQDIKGIDAFWTGKAADAFGERVKGVSQELKKVSDSAAPEGGAGIVDTLRNAAQDLQAAQAAMPVPASMLGELMAARDTRITLAPGVLEVELESGFFNNAPMSFAGWLGDQFRKVLTDVEEDARQAYDTVSQQHETAADRAPVGTPALGGNMPNVESPNLSGGGPGVGGGGMPSIGGAGGGGAGGFDVPKAGGSGVGNMPGLLDGSPIGKPTSPDLGGFEPGSGLAGAGGGLATTSPPGLGGLGGGGLGAGGLGSGAGLGSGGAGIGVPGGLGKVPGGGSLGKPITPTIAPMGGGLAGKGGGGSTRGAGGRLGAGGMAGIGGVGAGGAGAGRGTGAARGGGGMAGVGGVGAGAGGAGKGGGGKGAGGRGAGFLGGPGASGSGHGDEDEYDSWLHEDENVWNEGTDVPPPPVLGN